MNKIYQKMYPGNKNRSEGILGGFIHEAAPEDSLLESHPQAVKRAGFTLIELLVVVLIIGILAAIAVPQYTAAVDKAHASRLLVLGKSVKDALERYYMANGTYTQDFSLLDIQMPAGGVLSAGNGLRYDNGDFFSIMAAGSSNPWMVSAFNARWELDMRLNIGLDQSSWKGKMYCYAYNDNPKVHRLCKTLGGSPVSTTCGGSGACTAYLISN